MVRRRAQVTKSECHGGHTSGQLADATQAKLTTMSDPNDARRHRIWADEPSRDIPAHRQFRQRGRTLQARGSTLPGRSLQLARSLTSSPGASRLLVCVCQGRPGST